MTVQRDFIVRTITYKRVNDPQTWTSVGIDCRSGGWARQRRTKGK